MATNTNAEKVAVNHFHCIMSTELTRYTHWHRQVDGLPTRDVWRKSYMSYNSKVDNHLEPTAESLAMIKAFQENFRPGTLYIDSDVGLLLYEQFINFALNRPHQSSPDPNDNTTITTTTTCPCPCPLPFKAERSALRIYPDEPMTRRIFRNKHERTPSQLGPRRSNCCRKSRLEDHAELMEFLAKLNGESGQS